MRITAEDILNAVQDPCPEHPAYEVDYCPRCGTADWCLADNDVECTRHDENGDRREAECDHAETTAVDVPAMGWGQVREQHMMCVRCLAIVSSAPAYGTAATTQED
jgi:hypothetical protein